MSPDKGEHWTCERGSLLWPATKPAIYPGGVSAVLVTKCCGQIAFLRDNQDQVADQQCRKQRGQHLGQMPRQGDPQDDADTTEVERIA